MSIIIYKYLRFINIKLSIVKHTYYSQYVNICTKVFDLKKNEPSLLTNRMVVLVFSPHFFLANVNFFLSRRSRSPNVWIITIGIFPRPSATLPLHCINYRIGINLAARSGDRSTRIRNSLTSRLNQSFILHTWHLVYMKTKRGECIYTVMLAKVSIRCCF